MGNHALTIEFPEYVDKIDELKQQDAEFARMANEYHKLDHQIAGLESRNMPVADEHFEELKMQRLRLKDQIYKRLLNGQG
ncbi:hypothetical protein CGX12_11990 [Zobellella denitrificans]|jgi:hypothetical protein|uniref:Uncharacterized protein n=1 Tax=Zobellella denitrificans TaxID=347534 RepID=A0A231MY16_9GAMM|nr:DUF465 domain-containing protein [Zobellella denitrificans]ATG75096.1 hypothetical protein AN401_15510 [Zobellella denitrificans]OXS14875.1 hypothetical protein CGX12_11990 [Zobellella denitrificans]